MENLNVCRSTVRLDRWSPAQIDGKRVAFYSSNPAFPNAGKIQRGRIRTSGTPGGIVVRFYPEHSSDIRAGGSVCLGQEEVDRLIPASKGLPFDFLCFA